MNRQHLAPARTREVRLAVVVVIVGTAMAMTACGSFRYMKPVDEHQDRWHAMDDRDPVAASPVASLSAPIEDASSTTRLAVLEVNGAGLATDLKMLLADSVRAQALRALRGRGVTVMTRESMLAIMSDMGGCEGAIEGACEVETGRNIGADLLVTGDVTKVGAQYFFALKLFDVRNGALLSTKTLRGKEPAELVDAIEREAVVLFTEGMPSGP